jgi:hypothetical protein
MAEKQGLDLEIQALTCDVGLRRASGIKDLHSCTLCLFERWNPNYGLGILLMLLELKAKPFVDGFGGL